MCPFTSLGPHSSSLFNYHAYFYIITVYLYIYKQYVVLFDMFLTL